MSPEPILSALKTIIAPLVEADEGELYLIEATAAQVRLHLRGKFSGCPGNHLVSEQVILPVLREYFPQITLVVTSGPLLPEGAHRVTSSSSPSGPPAAEPSDSVPPQGEASRAEPPHSGPPPALES